MRPERRVGREQRVGGRSGDYSFGRESPHPYGPPRDARGPGQTNAAVPAAPHSDPGNGDAKYAGTKRSGTRGIRGSCDARAAGTYNDAIDPNSTATATTAARRKPNLMPVSLPREPTPSTPDLAP
ncbi:hypothetical protein GCM10023205_70520 [Yinghuangia aomiensis]|uniref:Uncharacterized protein n=1 Tax=Yinghuangia aomiensis TaxID=676205 RepID=A0ABP9I6G5_9ACTN